MNYIAIPGMKSRRNKSEAVGIDSNRPDDIINSIADYFGVPALSMKQKTRVREICYARHVCMYMLYKKTNLSLQSIGDIFGRDHTSVMHAKQSIKDLMQVHDNVRQDVIKIQDKL